jgi:hypothetical protein
MDRDKAKVILKEAIQNAFDEYELDDRWFYLGDDTINLMAESALNVLLSVEDIQNYIKKEGIKL